MIEQDRPSVMGGARDDLDRLIDEVVRSVAQPPSVDLRAQVLARLDEPIAERRSPFAFVLRPAVLAAAGVAFIAIGVAATWWHVNSQLQEGPAKRVVSHAATPQRPIREAAVETAAHAPAVEAPRVERAATRPAAARAVPAATSQQVFAAVWPSDTIAADEAEMVHLPGAPAGQLGEGIAPMPLPPPIVIPPIASLKPVVAPPILSVPPVSELVTPAGGRPADETSRDRQGPGKSGGFRP
jgi:hypothetical protein